MDAINIAARTVHFAAAMLLFGELLFALAVATPLWRGAGNAALEGRKGLVSLALTTGSWTLAASIASGAIWLIATAATMSGLPVTQAINSDTIGLVLGRTVFGRVWIWRLGLAVALGALLLGIGRSEGERRRLHLAVGALAVAAAYLATLAWMGHAAAGRLSDLQIQFVSDVAHLLAAGAWLGALPGLVVVLGRALPLEVAGRIVWRFSMLGMVSVAALVIGGLGNSWYLVGDLPALIGTSYGHLLLVKVALFAVMVALAALNRWSLAARLNTKDAGNLRPLRLLRRNAALEIVAGMFIMVIVGALGTKVPAAHQSPVWPFDYTLSWQAVQLSFGASAGLMAAAVVVCVAVVAAVGGALRRDWRLCTTGIGVTVAAGAICAWLLAVPAYPTTYAISPASYTTDSIARGASLYAQNCSSCHGPYGRGDGPAAASLSIVPADLAAHASGHRAGELYWWVAHGIPQTPMPAFAPLLSEAEIWDLVPFLLSQSYAAAATTLTNHVQPWSSVIVAPDFTFERAGQEQESLRRTEGPIITLLVLYSSPLSLPYLRALAAEASTFGEIGVRIIAVPLSGAVDTVDGKTSEGRSIVATASKDVVAAFAMFARPEADPDRTALTHVDYLIDRQGYIRARWLGVPDSPSSRIADVFDQAELLRRERQRAPAPAGHTH